MLRGNPALAIAEPASAHPAVRDVARVVTNHATGLEHPALSPVLVVRGDGEPDVLLAVAGAVGQGRLLAVGDASVVINAMLRYPGNRALCASLVRYVTEDDAWGKRGGKLYILANDFETTGTFGDDSRLGARWASLRRTLTDALEMLRHDGMPPWRRTSSRWRSGSGSWSGRARARAGRTSPSSRASCGRCRRRAQGGVAGHAAVIAAPGTSRVLAMLELKSALEEELSTRLGLDRPPPHDELVARVRGAAAPRRDASAADARGALARPARAHRGAAR